LTFQELGNKLVGEAKWAIAFRQVGTLNEIGLILSNLPIKEYRLIGQYYCAWCAFRGGDITPPVFEKVAKESTTHRASALITLAALEARKGSYESEWDFLIESLKYSDSLSTSIRAHKGIAVIKAKEGFHEAALKDLENFYPMIRQADADVYFDYLNSYAVELGEAGRKGEARNVIKHVISSPFAHAYPEWQETAKELKEPSRASISVPYIEREPLEVEIDEAQHASTEAKPIKPGRVVAFPELKEAPKPQKPGRVTPQEFGDMTPDERMELILAAIRSGAVRESDYIKLVMTLGLLESGPASEIIDLEDKALLNDIVEAWCNMIEPDEFAPVMSALRDCEDDLRRADIIDAMIAIAFKYTHTSMQTEQEWRLRVERKLPEK
jgi:hypothetical protein